MIHYFTEYGGSCSCGRTHDMVTKAAVIEGGCLFDFEKYMTEFGVTGKRCALYGQNGYRATADRQIIVSSRRSLFATFRARGHIDENRIGRLHLL